MRDDRGYWCLPEVDLGTPVTDEMFAAVTSRLSVATAAEALTTGRRFTAPEALAAGIVDHTAAEADVLERAVELATPHAAKNRQVRSEEHTSELQSLMRISYAVFCFKKQKQ